MPASADVRTLTDQRASPFRVTETKSDDDLFWQSEMIGSCFAGLAPGSVGVVGDARIVGEFTGQYMLRSRTRAQGFRQRCGSRRRVG